MQSGRNRTIHYLKQKPDQQYEDVDHIDMVNINSVYFSNKHSVITASLKTSSNQASVLVPFKVDIK